MQQVIVLLLKAISVVATAVIAGQADAICVLMQLVLVVDVTVLLPSTW